MRIEQRRDDWKHATVSVRGCFPSDGDLRHANITTTSTYLRSTPVRLKRALDKLEAAGFGHYSDKQPETDTSAAPKHGAEDRAN